ncbi:FecR family protein [Mucilaginibacter sp. E4BP6]|uniref:FecR family protein n=1 Tax=Mucilaginibacter sp. E4BP6 TaxID=2723089 RepID=UPI0015C99ACD|nr:FecR family protein [Mucilaginibacter sp. E4BP6]NYE64571.1 ferric-dicitrate binding protein FerR (iron transport regulator) [Mucilaginibacter sp. E4BP6]
MEEERFTELLAKKLSGDITPDELAEFNRLIAGNTSFQKEYELIRSYWMQDDEPYDNMVGILEKIKQRAGITDIDENTVSVIEIHSPKNSRLWLRNIAAAAIAIIALSACFYFFRIYSPGHPVSARLTELKTNNGSIAKIRLADGTLVTLNTLSTLTYPKNFTGKTREVFLNGEAFFDVAKDHSHPFIVHTNQSDIQVLGTAFDIKSYKNDPQFEATLFRGSIQATLKDNPTIKVILKPTDKLLIQHTSYSLTKETYFDDSNTLNIETAWMNNKLVFKNEPFEQLANSLERKYGNNIIFKNDLLKSIKFTGEFEKEDINQILLSLQIVTRFNYKISGNNIYIF